MPSLRKVEYLDYTPEQLYKLVIDVEYYKEFLPWCHDAVIKEKGDNYFLADLEIKYKFFKERYTSRVDHFKLNDNEYKVEASLREGPFHYLHNSWHILLEDENKDKTKIVFNIDFSLKSLILDKLISSKLEKAAGKMMNAFISRAHEIYG